MSRIVLGNCVITILFAIVIVYCVVSSGGCDGEPMALDKAIAAENAKHPPKHRAPNAKVFFGETTVEIWNSDSEDWHSIGLFANSQPPFGYSCSISLKAGQKGVYRLNGFTKDDGTRFNPYTTKLLRLWIGGDGYDYREFGR